MKKPPLWRWAPSGIVFRKLAVEADGELLWVNERLPAAPAERARYVLAVEVFCWFATLDAMNEGLVVLHDYFHADSLLAAVRRRDDATRVLLFTAARESLVHDRYVAVRSVLRPTAIGLRFGRDAAWESLAAIIEDRRDADAQRGLEAAP